MKSLYDKAQARIKRLEDSLEREPLYHYPNQKYWYVMGVTKEKGKVVALGPFMSESEASGELAKLADGELFCYSTRSLERATRQMKAELLARGDVSPDDALKRMLHEKGLQREEQRSRE